ncbi:hypothetical protein [Burkholderia pseudomallei]|uniref:hypothetical protein n=2 Tax=Burkholderia pseudomallei TaxID=28450 RepID=UPI0009B23CCD|nr:hypothetical protein [Burkholderia pseudomallei]RXS79829.1 hypothetical protein C2U63_15970 [Burkholderia pseudomallei]
MVLFKEWSSMSSEFQFTSNFQNTDVFILDCLPSNETSRERLYNPLRDLDAFGGVRKRFVRWCISDGRKLQALLQIIAQWAVAGIMPVIHIECHGSADAGLEIGDAGDVMDWTTLASLLTPINAACRGNLGVVMGVCEGLSAAVSVDFEEPSRFCFLVGSNGRPTSGLLQDEMPVFYRTLFEARDVGAALRCVPSFQTYYAEQMLVTKLLYDIAERCTGRGRTEWREGLLSKIAEESGVSLDTSRLRSERARIKAMTGDDAVKCAVEFVARRFLHRPASFDVDALMEHARISREHMPPVDAR